MSYWYPLSNENIDVNLDSEEVQLHIPHPDDNGAIYGTLTFDQVCNLFLKINLSYRKTKC